MVADFGRHVLVEDANDVVHPCTVKGRQLRVVCGDRVEWRAGTHGGRAIVEARLPRDSELIRPDARGRPDTVVANIDQIIVIGALAPHFDLNLIDRYLVAAELMGVKAAVVCNKIELAANVGRESSDQFLDEYEAVPYPVLRTSVKTGVGLEQLADQASGHTSILVGQSGVGKSSLLNALRPQTDAVVGELSSGSGEGTHTTRASRLYKLPGGGEIIDSPGVREYTPHVERDRDPADGYAEFEAPARDCRFRNCRHLNEPDCGIKSAAEAGRISTRRYHSYLRLLDACLNGKPP